MLSRLRRRLSARFRVGTQIETIRDWLDHTWCRNGHDEMAASIRERLHLPHDFLLEVPGEHNHVRSSCGIPALGWLDENMGAWRKASLLVSAAVEDDPQLLSNLWTIVEQRVGLRRCPVADQPRAGVREAVDQRLEAGFPRDHAVGERLQAVDVRQRLLLLGFEHLPQAVRRP